MVNFVGLSVIAILMIAQEPTPSAPTNIDSSKAVKSALGKGSFPWYDESTDSARPIKLRTESENSSSSSNSGYGSGSGRSSLGFLGMLGNAVAMLCFGIALVVFLGLLVWFWRIYEPSDGDETDGGPKKKGEPSRIDSLPEGMEREFETSDPWEEAIRRRNRGDLAGAIICLFAHQLLTLSRLGVVRLAPGRTGRQLLKAVTDGELRGMVHPTLRLFEVVYYGHRQPSETEFAAIWSGAEAFERRVAAGVAR